MLKLLLKKQLTEVFKGYFYNAKKNKMHPKWVVVTWFAFFIVLMFGVLGGGFTFLSYTLCKPMVQVSMGWLYFLIMCGIAILLGAFGSVFNTYSSLYLSKDNDLLLSMPIPARTIIASRVINVYVLGTLYSSVVLLPMLIVYWVVAGPSVVRIICGIVLFLVVTVFILLISCLLGWVVAKVSQKTKNKSFFTVLVSLLFVGGYYFFYFKAKDFINELILNADTYGKQIKGTAYGLYLFGRIGEGDWMAAALFAVIMAAASVLVWKLLSGTFLGMVTSGGKTGKVRYVEKRAKAKTASGALLAKEFARFTSSSSYMLNCGLGIVLLPAAGIFMLIMGRDIWAAVEDIFVNNAGSAAVLFCAAFCVAASMNYMVVPSVSLEGKSLWIPQSLPVETKQVLRAKLNMQVILTAVPMLFAVICTVMVIKASPVIKLLICVTSVMYVLFSAVFGLVIGIKMPLFNWTNESAPVKQSGAVLLILLSTWAIIAAMAGLYLFIGYEIGPVYYMLLWIVIFGAAGLLLLRWLDTRGCRLFRQL